jgi:hypothetical protein
LPGGAPNDAAWPARRKKQQARRTRVRGETYV